MSLIILRAAVLPRWSTIATRTTFAKLLYQLAKPQTIYATVYTFDTMAYVIVRERCGETCYQQLSEDQWNLVNHVISVDPLTCACSICNWRKKRKKFLDPKREFKHLLLA